jgi:ubiquinone/menaquinone biosynthesis C-methylase UbiE
MIGLDSWMPIEVEPSAHEGSSDRIAAIRTVFDRLAPTRRQWIERNRYFYEADYAYMRFLIPPGTRVLDLGCGTGDLLSALAPSHGVGIDLSPEMVRIARETYPTLEFFAGDIEDPAVIGAIEGPFDYVILSETIGYLADCETTLTSIRRLTTPTTRLIVAYYSRLWEPWLRLAEWLGAKMPSYEQNWLATSDTRNLLNLAGYEVVHREWRLLLPRRALGLEILVNQFLAPLPGFRRLCLRNYVVGRPLPYVDPVHPLPSVSVIVPCRNERGNIESAVQRLPQFTSVQEIIFVEGHSSDGTYEECLRVRDAYPNTAIQVLRQDAKGKGDAVRKGFAAARGDILIILDADLTVPPESIPKFYWALVNKRAEFVNGTRMVYAMESGAMRWLNNLANRAFALIFSFLLNQRFTDTLCGTKALWRRDYDRIAANRAYFGDLDPFGDFDLIFGASKLTLKTIEVPIRYLDRRYGETQISRFHHGALLARMVLSAWRKFKAF